jgi:hypothetical protein
MGALLLLADVGRGFLAPSIGVQEGVAMDSLKCPTVLHSALRPSYTPLDTLRRAPLAPSSIEVTFGDKTGSQTVR